MENKLTKELIKLENDLNSSSYILKSCFNTLNNNHCAIDYFIASNESTKEKGEKILDLYGLLQVLFVCIDTLYQLSYKITSSKNFININENKALRELKYIRNDVVGHPTNRLVDKHIEYAILNGEDIKDDCFSYHIYFDGNETLKNVKYKDLIDAYYKEAYEFICAIDSYVTSAQTTYLIDDIINIYNAFINDKDIRVHLSMLKKACSKEEQDSRIFKKINLITRLFKDYQKESSSTLRYIISYQIAKLVEYVCTAENIKQTFKMIRMPNSLKKVFEFFDNNKELVELLNNIYDYNHPLFTSSIDHIIKAAKRQKNHNVIDYFSTIQEYSFKHDKDYVYAYSIVLKEYKNKR